jgi:hypothetical protein
MTGRRASSTRIRRSRLRRCTVLPAGTQVLGPQVIGNEPRAPGFGKGSRNEAGAELRSRLSLQSEAAPQFDEAELLTPAVKRDQAAD